MRVELSPRFKREYKKLSSENHKRTKKAIELFVKDRNHPSIRFKKIQGFDEKPDIMEISVTMDIRISLQIYPDHYYFRHIGSHKILKKP